MTALELLPASVLGWRDQATRDGLKEESAWGAGEVQARLNGCESAVVVLEQLFMQGVALAGAAGAAEHAHPTLKALEVELGQNSSRKVKVGGLSSSGPARPPTGPGDWAAAGPWVSAPAGLLEAARQQLSGERSRREHRGRRERALVQECTHTLLVLESLEAENAARGSPFPAPTPAAPFVAEWRRARGGPVLGRARPKSGSLQRGDDSDGHHARGGADALKDSILAIPSLDSALPLLPATQALVPLSAAASAEADGAVRVSAETSHQGEEAPAVPSEQRSAGAAEAAGAGVESPGKAVSTPGQAHWQSFSDLDAVDGCSPRRPHGTMAWLTRFQFNFQSSSTTTKAFS
jgi:hypothetical protein